ncbi:hypothetical protein [Caenimonas soli]|uniref:hypothetical protein n=1 Tax=Caenimonas soli TaxID=2735555 RepID=UPI0015571FE5|nr:hypothetical protein [Caenimonas soli]NPC56097.1 hypothetical protein [Caenimonas soli]
MKTTPSRLLFALASTAIFLAGCGGGGGGSSPAPDTSSTLSSVPVTVIDGVIRNATVCLDKNLNGACDSDEPSGRTDNAGNVVLQVEAADVGRYPVLAVVGTDAVDADHGPVTQPFVMKAPADRTTVVSPLTTLVQTAVDNTGATSAEAETSVKAQLGINVSLFDDFTKSTSTDSANAGAIARMVVVATQEQSAALASAVGTAAVDGTVITQADLNKAIEQKMLENLSALVTATSDPRILAATTPEAKAEAVAAVAQELVAAPGTGLTATAVATVVAINNQSAAGAPAVDMPSAGFTLRQLNFTSAQAWFARVFTSTLAQNTPDSSGNVRFVDRRSRSNSGVVAKWNTGGDPTRQADLHWNGASWVNCGLNGENRSSVRDAQGRSSYDYCDKLETGGSNTAFFDISGRSMIDVYNQVTGAGFANLTIASASTVLGSATYPVGSKLGYQVGTPLTTAPAYYPGSSSIVVNTNAAVAAGKTSASDTTSACASITPSTPSSSYQSPATTLESVIAANPGTPCVFGPGTVVVSTSFGGTTTVSSGSRNEWWSQSSISVGVLGTAPTGGVQTSYWTTNTLLRVAFGAGNAVNYFSCQQRSTDGSSRNCDLIGTGNYTVTTLGDARILTLGNPPAQTAALTYNRVFVERGGKVYLGYQNKPTATSTARLNTTAAGALFSQLGLPAVDPDTPLALTQASYQGDWVVTAAGETDPSQSTTLRLFGNGSSAQCLSNSTSPATQETCSVSVTPASGAVTVTFGDGVFSGILDFLAGAVSGTFTATDPAEPVQSIVGTRR